MTALKGVERLEAEATYTPAPDADAEPVLLTFGDAALTILRFDETPIDHWPLASLRRVKDGAKGLTLAPDHAAPDRLHIADRDMIAAIKAVAGGLDAPSTPRRPRKRRSLRMAVAALALAAFGAGGWLLWPRALDAAASAAPPGARAALGDAAVAAAIGDQACRDPAALRALARWSRRAAGAIATPVKLYVASGDRPAAVAAPGGRVVLAARLFASDDPIPAAAALDAALQAAAARPPMAAALAAAGAAGLVELLRGAPDGPALTAAAAAALDAPPPPTAEEEERDPVPAAAAEWAAIRRGCAE